LKDGGDNYEPSHPPSETYNIFKLNSITRWRAADSRDGISKKPARPGHRSALANRRKAANLMVIPRRTEGPMTAQAPKPDEDKGRVIRFEPRRAPPRPPPPGVSPVADLRQYSRPGDDADDYRHRMKTNAAALVLVVALIWCGYWLFDTLAEMRRNQDCALTGRSNCATITVPAQSRR
jgi:hypothetical protein